MRYANIKFEGKNINNIGDQLQIVAMRKVLS